MIGRKKELALLRQLLESPRSEFAVVYGRRRIGKTFMIRQAFADTLVFSHTGVENVNLCGQLRAFTSSLKDAGAKPVRRLSSWFDAFDELKSLVLASPNAKKVLFLDELPWMDTPKSSFVQALEFFWNGWCSARNDIVLVACGSATSWVVNKILKAKRAARSPCI